uniref:Glycerophosphodiester phosphodiesterase n=1 Tax=Ignisphaera aggregans TaxID=334771 RepID=A0A7J3QFV5_9CREN
MNSWRNKFLLIAHRGASAYEPENTLAAFRKAIEMGADAIEFDVRFTRDGIPIIIHDEDLKRVAGIEERVCNLTLDKLKKIVIMGKEQVPTLDEVLSEFRGKIAMFIEIKELIDEKYIVKLLNDYDVLDQSLVISFNYEYLKKIKELNSSIEIGLLTYIRPLPIDQAVKLKAFAILPRYNLITPNIVKEIHSKKLKVYTWTVNDVSIALKIINYGVDGFATDDPAIRGKIEKQSKLY